MTTPVPVTPIAIEDYDAIEAAVMETRRGRWFLEEYARRNRNCDTASVLSALDRIERTVRRERAAPDIDRIRLDLADMAEAIARTKQEIAQMKVDADHGGRFAEASQELDAIVEQTETATNDILLAAEGIQEVAWTLREAGAAPDLCEKLDSHATDVYTACSFQDLTGQRTRKVVTVLRYLESRITTMIDIWGLEEEDLRPAAPAGGPFDPMDARADAHLLNGPQLQGRGVAQDEVDELMWAETDPEPEEDVFATASTTEDDAPAAAEPDLEPAADVFAPAEAAPVEFDDVDLAAADVFATEPSDRPADVFAPSEEIEFEPVVAPVAVATPSVTTRTVGNTVMRVESLPDAEAEATPRLAVVEDVDPIAGLSAEARLVTFG